MPLFNYMAINGQFMGVTMCYWVANMTQTREIPSCFWVTCFILPNLWHVVTEGMDPINK